MAQSIMMLCIICIPIKLIKSDTLCKSWRKVIPMESAIEENDQDEADSNQDEADDRDCTDCRHEVGCDVNQEELEAWLNSDCNDPCFGLFTDEQICQMVAADSDTGNESPEELEVEEEPVKCPVTDSG